MQPNNTSALLQRRLSQAQFASLNPVDVMSSFSMSFRPDASAASAGMMGLTMDDLQAQQMPPAMAPSDFFKPAMMDDLQIVAPPLSYSDAFNQSAAYNAATFGSLAWPTNTAPPATFMPNLTLRTDSYNSSESYGSTDSDPLIKSEDHSPIDPAQIFYDAPPFSASPDSGSSIDSSDDVKPAVFSTDIDTLMRAIQSKTQESKQQDSPSSSQRKHSTTSTASTASLSNASSPVSTNTSSRSAKRRYPCTAPDCSKSFSQKTHLEIHTRAHTGIKPFVCKEPTCGQRFSQLGNLKTHERRHTGERPYHCDICGKTFAQHGNVRAHKIVHTAAKPFTCKLDHCNKRFTQLGNLKSHQNKFHVETIRRLKERFMNIKEGDVVDKWEKEMWEYFGGLYKNCNKGIKGRGKDRRISNTVQYTDGPSHVEGQDRSVEMQGGYRPQQQQQQQHDGKQFALPPDMQSRRNSLVDATSSIMLAPPPPPPPMSMGMPVMPNPAGDHHGASFRGM